MNGLSSLSPHTIRALTSISFVTTRSAEIALGVLGRFNVGGRTIDCCRRGGHRGNRLVYTEVTTNRGYTVIASTNVPTVSSPKRRLIRRYRRHKVRIISIPNPATFTATLTVSNVSAKHFAFRNFLDISGGSHFRRLSRVGSRGQAVIFCRTPRGLIGALESLCTTLKGEGVTVIQRVAGVRRRIVGAALGGTGRLCYSKRLGNRVILVVRNGGRRPIRRFALSRTIGGTTRLITTKVAVDHTTGRITTAAPFGGSSVCGRLIRDRV